MNQALGTLAFNECCQRILVAIKKAKPGAAIGWAHGYAKAGLSMTDRREIKSQALYLLSNLNTWRGDEAKMVKETLKEFAKD